MLKACRILALVALAGAMAYGREVLVALQFAGRAFEALAGVL